MTKEQILKTIITQYEEQNEKSIDFYDNNLSLEIAGISLFIEHLSTYSDAMTLVTAQFDSLSIVIDYDAKRYRRSETIEEMAEAVAGYVDEALKLKKRIILPTKTESILLDSALDLLLEDLQERLDVANSWDEYGEEEEEIKEIRENILSVETLLEKVKFN